jgi:hypothetical protein
MPFDGPENPLMVEIQQEMASAYFASCKKMVAALDALKALDQTLASGTPTRDQITRRAELLAEAGERVYYLVIQREAMKLSGYEKFFQDYEIPDEVRKRMGPKPPK